MSSYRQNPKTKDYNDFDTMHYYLKEIKHIPLLTQEQEIELSERIQKGDEQARNIMIESNLQLVVWVAKKYIRYGLAFADLIEEGNVGLMKAVDKFKGAKGFKFSTYGTWWIKQEIERGIMNQSRTIRLPVHLREQASRYYKEFKNFILEEGHEPDNEELAIKMHVPVEQIEIIKEVMQDTYSLDKPMGGEDDSEDTLQDVVEDTNIRNIAEDIDAEKRKKIIAFWLKKLTVSERRVINARFGLTGEEPLEQEDIAKELDVTRQMISIIERQSLNKLRTIVSKLGITIEQVL